MHINNHQPTTGNTCMSVQNKATTWAQVYDNHAPMLYGIILKMTDDESITENILVEAFDELHAENTLGEINALVCIRCAYKKTFKYLTDRGLAVHNKPLFDKNCPCVNQFYIKGMNLEKIIVDLEITKEEALNKLRAEFKYLRGQYK